MNRRLAEAFPHVYCELDFTTPLELAVATILSAQSTDKRVNLVTPALFASYRTRARLRGGRPHRARGADPAHRLLPQQGQLADRARPGAGRAVRRRGAAPHDRTGDAARVSAARPPTSSSATPSTFRASPSTPTSAGWCGAGAGPTKRTRSRSSTRRRADRAQRVDPAVPSGDLPRPAGLPRPQAGLRSVRAGQGLPVVRDRAHRPADGRGAGEGPGDRAPAGAGRAVTASASFERQAAGPGGARRRRRVDRRGLASRQRHPRPDFYRRPGDLRGPVDRRPQRRRAGARPARAQPICRRARLRRRAPPDGPLRGIVVECVGDGASVDVGRGRWPVGRPCSTCGRTGARRAPKNLPVMEEYALRAGDCGDGGDRAHRPERGERAAGSLGTTCGCPGCRTVRTCAGRGRAARRDARDGGRCARTVRVAEGACPGRSPAPTRSPRLSRAHLRGCPHGAVLVAAVWPPPNSTDPRGLNPVLTRDACRTATVLRQAAVLVLFGGSREPDPLARGGLPATPMYCSLSVPRPCASTVGRSPFPAAPPTRRTTARSRPPCVRRRRRPGSTRTVCDRWRCCPNCSFLRRDSTSTPVVAYWREAQPGRGGRSRRSGSRRACTSA